MYRGMKVVPLYFTVEIADVTTSMGQFNSRKLPFLQEVRSFSFFFRCRPATRPQTLPKHTRGPVRKPFCRRIFLAPRQSF